MTDAKLDRWARFAVIATGGKQYRVSEGDKISVEKLGSVAGNKIIFDKVMLVDDGHTTQIGTPYLNNVAVEAFVISEKKGKKVVGATYKAKSNRRKKYGHRQTLTTLRIEKIN